MQEQKLPVSRTTIIWILVAVLGIAGIVTLVFAFSGSNSPEEDVNVIYTNAAATVQAQQLTLQASQPTATVTPFVTLTPLATNTALASATLPQLSILPTKTQGLVGGGCDNSVYVSDVTIPDNTVVKPGEAMTKTWKVQNNGTCTWTATYKIMNVAGNAMGGTATAIGQSVGPGQSVDVSVAMVAPAAAGKAEGTWRLANDSAQPFGTVLTIVVSVGGGTSATGTATTATAGTPTSKPTAANNPTISLTCTLGGTGGVQYEHAGTLTWEDMSNNETGFKIYVNGTVVFTTSANATTYSIPAGTFRDAGFVTTFGIGAVNSAGEANVANVSQTCP